MRITAKQGWHEIGGKRIYCRSGWEAKVANYFQRQKELNLIAEWEHEPKTFWFENIKRGTRSYLPDFKITTCEGNHYWVEVKGYMDAKSTTKIRRFGKYYPEERLEVYGKEWLQKNKLLV